MIHSENTVKAIEAAELCVMVQDMITDMDNQNTDDVARIHNALTEILLPHYIDRDGSEAGARDRVRAEIESRLNMSAS